MIFRFWQIFRVDDEIIIPISETKIVLLVLWFCVKILFRQYNSTNVKYDCRSDYIRAILFFFI